MLAGLAVSSRSREVQQFSFRFSSGAFRSDEIFESATSTPSRYLLEIGRRMAAASSSADLFVIGNPLLPLTPSRLIEWAADDITGPAVFTDHAGFPAAYCIPRRVFEAVSRPLLLLSAVDGEIDGEILAHIAETDVSRRLLTMADLDAFPGMSANGWLNPDKRLRAPQLQAKLAVEIMRRRPDWRTLPFALFHPYHAGDALFVALASRQATPLLYEKQIVCSAFLDVVSAAAPAVEPVELSLPPMARDGTVSKYRYFANAVEQLGPVFTGENFVVFGRLMRMHHYTPFHLIDHARFTLGDPMDSVSRTIYGQPPARVVLCGHPTKPFRLLFHLNGGWPLKTYPDQSVNVLFDVLCSLGCEITVLDRPDLERSGVHSIAGGATAALKDAVEQNHLFVGVDSYPLHFAKMIAGRPAIGLFGSTKPCNHDAPRGRDYRALVGSLPCNTCLSKNGCPMFGGTACPNYVKPQDVVAGIVEMAAEYYGVSLVG